MNNDDYEVLPYDGLSHVASHPSRLACLGLLFGMHPALPSRCRVLELGCAQGYNLVPMALAASESTFLGIDLSPRQIADGKKLIGELGLRNIVLQQADMLDLSDDLGEFDYIICHGVYSWVGPAEQEKILEICRRHLAPQGIAHISYNTFPGWHLGQIIRGVLNFPGAKRTDVRDRVAEGRRFLDQLALALGPQEDPYAQTVKQFAKDAKAMTDAYLAHEHLERSNAPVYFYEFCGRLDAHALQYLCEAEAHTMGPSGCSPEAIAALGGLPTDMIARQQCLDFLRNRSFRQTLVCHRDVALDQFARPQALESLFVASWAGPRTPSPDLDSNAVTEFGSPQAYLGTSDPMFKHAMTYLAGQWPRAVSFDELAGAACTRRLADPALQIGPERERLAQVVLQGFFSTPLFELFREPLPLTLEIAEFPTASGLARWQCQTGSRVVNLCHRTLALPPVERQLLPYLDGKTRCADLPRILPPSLRAAVEGDLVVRLKHLARNALLLDTGAGRPVSR